jgi:hypothetical protein
VQAGDEISHGDINETRRRDRQQYGAMRLASVKE